jgi:hypothetical protein
MSMEKGILGGREIGIEGDDIGIKRKVERI